MIQRWFQFIIAIDQLYVVHNALQQQIGHIINCLVVAAHAMQLHLVTLGSSHKAHWLVSLGKCVYY